MFPPTFTSFDGTPIRCWAAAPSSRPAAAKVLLVHDFGAHSESLHFRYLRDHLLDQGYAVYGFDLRGHGRSGGRRAYVDRWEDFREDLRRFVDIVERDGGPAPLFMFGVSLGGLIAVNYTLHHPAGIRGLIAHAPALDASGVPAWLRGLAAVLSKVAPRLRLDPRLDPTRLTRDEEAQRAFNSDPLRQTKMTLRLGAEIRAAMAETLARLPQLELPLLVSHGSADVIVPPVASERLHRLAGSKDKEYRVYEGAYHVLSMELNREQVFRDISGWIRKRLV